MNYLTADLFNPHAMVKMDIVNIEYPDNSFDVIYCSHVLEHVHEDRKAINEFYRVLKPNSWAVFQVPILAEKTFEDNSITNPSEREKLFGQYDHVRCYGPGFKDRLSEAGFNVKVFSAQKFGDAACLRIMSVSENETIFFFARNIGHPGLMLDYIILF